MPLTIKHKNENGEWESMIAASAANIVSFDNSSTDLNARNVQTALEEISGKMKNDNTIKGKKVTFFGDSTLWVSDNAVTWLHSSYGVNTQNLAETSTGFYAGESQGKNFASKISLVDSGTELICVEFGFNDLGSKQIGTVDDSGTDTLAGYVNSFFDSLNTTFPVTPIVCFSGGCTATNHPGVKKADEWTEMVKSICRRKCVPYDGGMYDGFVLKPWIPANREKWFRDQYHPNADGAKVMAKYISKLISDNLL